MANKTCSYHSILIYMMALNDYSFTMVFTWYSVVNVQKNNNILKDYMFHGIYMEL